MRDVPAALAAHLLGDVTTLAVCWRVERRDGVLILGTEHDQPIPISALGSPVNPYAGEYQAHAGITGSDVRSTSDLSVDNMEVSGAINRGDLQVLDLSAADIEAGLFDDASVVLFLVNWQAPEDGQLVIRCGHIGEISRTSEGRYKTELRGLTQRLSQTIIRTYLETCDADLGDTRCGVDLVAMTVAGEVTSITSRRKFGALLSAGSPTFAVGTFNGGLVYWTSGDNQGFSMEVKFEPSGSPGEFELYLPMPRDIVVGDSFTIRPGCDKLLPTCRDRFANVPRFRGHGVFTPGLNKLLRGPDRGAGPT